MAREIERKFLVRDTSWMAKAEKKTIKQGYLSTDKQATVRVRIKGDKSFLTIKGISSGMARDEFEYEIPLADAEALLKMCTGPLIEKTRYSIRVQGLLWEVDRFYGANDGLILAEVELENEQQQIKLPGWVGREVTDDARYYNANLVNHPFSMWGRSTK